MIRIAATDADSYFLSIVIFSFPYFMNLLT